MMSTRKRFATVAAGAALSLVLAGCGSDEDSPEETTASTQESTQDSADETDADAGADQTEDVTDSDTETDTDTDTESDETEGADDGETGSDAGATDGEDISIEEFMAMLTSPGEEVMSSYTLAMVIGAGGQDIEMSGDMDLSGDQPAMRMTMGGAGLGTGSGMEMILAEGRMFMSMEGVTEPGKFMEMPPEMVGDQADLFEQTDLSTQWDAIEQGAQQVLFVGEEDVNGSPMRHYQVTVDADVVAQTSEDDSLAGMDDFIYHLWFDSDNLMRKMVIDMDIPEGEDIGMGTVSIESFMDNWGEKFDIQPPADEDLQDVPGM